MVNQLEDLVQRATGLRTEGRIEEALIAARKATQLNPDSASAWWQLALATEQKDSLQAAIPALEKVTKLAPHFSNGWGKLAWAYHATKRLNDAIDSADEGQRQDPDSEYCLRILAYALKHRADKADNPRRLEVLQRLDRLGELDEDEHFDLAFLLADLRDHLQAAHVYETYTRKHGNLAPSAYFNLSLAYEVIGRDLDALDAVAKATACESIRPELKERCVTQHDLVGKRLRAVRARLIERAHLSLDSHALYRYYINPFVLLNVDSVFDVAEPKALQRARQSVFREIELEDGKLEWMPGLDLDKSSAMSALDVLSNESAWEAHRAVFENKPLCDFLMKGTLKHFLAASDLKTYELPYLLPEATLTIIGPKFAAQYDYLLTRAIESGDHAAVECLFDGRRWVLPEHQDQCFEGAKRAVESLYEPLETLVLTATEKPPTIPEIKAAMAKKGLDSILTYLPIEFHETHTKVTQILRSLSIAHFNKHDDADSAKQIVLLGKVSADKSPALNHQMKEDLNFLDAAIAKERQYEAHLTLKGEQLAITKEGVRLGKEFLAPDAIAGMRWGGMRLSANPKRIKYVITFIGGPNKPIIDVDWTVTNDFETQGKFWENLVQASMNYIMPTVCENLKARLRNGAQERVGPVVVSKVGIEFTYVSWFSQKTVLIPWHDVLSVFDAGVVRLRSRTNSKAHAQLDIVAHTNAHLVHILCSADNKTL